MWLLGCAIGWAAPLDPEAATAAMIARDPAVVAADRAIDTARGERAEAAVFLANPTAWGGPGLTGHGSQLQVEQPVSLTREGALARQGAELGIAAGAAAARRAHLVAAGTARERLVAVAVADARAGLADQGLDAARRLREAVTARLAAGESSDLHLRLARLAETRAALAAVEARADANALRADVAGRAGIAPDDVPTDAWSTPTAQGGPETRSDVEAARLAADAARVGVRREKAAVLPPIGVGLWWQDEGAADIAGPSASIEIPVWARNQGAIAQQAATLAVAEAEARVAEARAPAERAATAATRDYVDALDFDRAAAIADAAAALAALRASWEAGEIALVDTLLTQQQILDGRLAAVTLAGQIATARLRALVADDDPALLPR